MQQAVEGGCRQPRHHALEQALAHAPHALFAQRHRQRLAGIQRITHALERTDVLGQRVVHQHLAFAFGLQAVEHALGTLHLAGQHGLAQLEHVVARHVEHRRFDLLGTQLTMRIEQAQLLDFLVRRQQVALDAVGKESQCMLAFGAGSHLLPLQAQTRGNPARQHLALHAFHRNRHAMPFQRHEPATALCGLVQPRQRHHHQQGIVAGAGFGNLLQRLAAVLARLATGDVDFDDLLFGKQAERLGGGQHRAPVETHARHGMR